MKKIRTVLSYIIIATVLILTPTVAIKKTTAKNSFPYKTEVCKYVLTIWHVDTFEGGVGSRAQFLTDVAKEYNQDGVLILVIPHTLESLKKSLEDGNLPDMVSYGVGASFVSGKVKEIKGTAFKGGEVGDKCYATAWATGGYFLIYRKDGDISGKIKKVIVSQGNYNLPLYALSSLNLSVAETVIKEPLSAYTEFLADENAVLLGTQRDLARLEKRGVNFSAEYIDGFSDLVQYISVTATDSDRYCESVNFINYLTESNVQKKLKKIGMASCYTDVYESGMLSKIKGENIKKTISPFTDCEFLKELINGENTFPLSAEKLQRIENTLKCL